MTFRPDATDDFIGIFNGLKSRIASFEGCNRVHLYRDAIQQNVFFTISEWDSEEALENYRHSELFEQVWGRAKTYFDAKPEAWTLIEG
jgi:(4S)-4-hydroxy-5-phosphonooxypentane-2,3-dione isomerase